jgi:nitrate/nitrite-specific signal transduction histidine kinase
MSFPILDSFGQSKGVLAGLFHLQTIPENAFYATIAQLKLEAHGSAYLVDGNGRVIYHTATDKIGADFSEREVAREVLFGNEGSMRTIDSQGQDVVASYAPVPGTRWGLVTQESWQALLGSSQTYAQFLLLLIALGVVIPAVVVALGVRRITQPIADLTRAAQDVASGHFGQTIVAHTGDELETLAEQFNIMSLELQDSYANLENRVADRTRELDTINKISSVVSRSLDLDKILGDALETACLALNLKQGSIMLFGDHQEASTQVSRGFGEDLQADMIRFPFIETVAHQAVRAREPVVQKFQGDSNSANGLSQADLNCDLLVSVPIQSKGQVLGVLNLCSDSQRAFKPEELEMLKAIGNHIGIGIENARLYKQAEHSAALAERNRLARDLHDAVSQTLFSASMIAEVLPRIWERDPQEGRRDLEQLRLLTRGALAEMRTLLLELRPAALADSDLGDLIRQLAESITGRTELAVHLELGLEGVLPLEVKVALYRICQEALNNVIKHAEASGVSISLYADPQEAELCIADDGAGFDPEIRLPGHLGLGIIQERAASIGASLAWESHPGSGTELKVNWLSGTEEDL